MGRLVISGLDNISEELGCSRKTLYKWIHTKEFPAFRMDGVWRVLPDDARQWLRECRSEHRRSTARNSTYPQ